MALYTRKQHDKHLEAIEAAESSISSAIAGVEYAGRLHPYIDDYIEISQMFWDRCPLTGAKMELPGTDVRDVARVFNHLVVGCPLTGLGSFRFNTTMERCRRKIKGQLFKTRMIMDSNKNQSKCADKDNHIQPCSCKPLRLYQLAQAAEEGEA